LSLWTNQLEMPVSTAFSSSLGLELTFDKSCSPDVVM
jgi:hypothetical protein